MSDRSFQKVKQIITALPGVERSYKFSIEAIREIATAFPRCHFEAGATMNRIIDVMRSEGVDYLEISEEELVEIVNNISQCISREEIGTTSRPGVLQWVLGSIGGANAPAGASAEQTAINRRIGEFMGTEADRARNLSPNQFLARSGDFKEFFKKLTNSGGVIDEETVQAAFASKSDKVYHALMKRLEERGRLIGITPPREFENINPLDYNAVVAAYYGSKAAVKEILVSLFENEEPSAESVAILALSAATQSGQAEIVKEILRMIPDDLMTIIKEDEIVAVEIRDSTNSPLFRAQMSKFPVKGREYVKTFEAYYDAVDNDPDGYSYPEFLFVPFDLSPDIAKRLNIKKLAEFLRKLGPDSLPGRVILGRITGLDDTAEVLPLIAHMPLEALRPVLDLLPEGEVHEEEIDPNSRQQTEEFIERNFKYPDGYVQYFIDRGHY